MISFTCIVLKRQYQVIHNQSNLSFQTYFEEFTNYILIKDVKISTQIIWQIVT